MVVILGGFTNVGAEEELEASRGEEDKHADGVTMATAKTGVADAR